MNGDRAMRFLPALSWHPVGALALLGCVGVFHLLTMRAGHGWGGDFSLYILHAANLADGQPYGDTGYIADPYMGPQTYPPVFPLLLSPIYRIWGFDLEPMKWLVAGFFVVGLWFVYLFVRRERDTGSALIVVGLTGFNPWLWDFKDQVLSDIPFMAAVFLALTVAQRALDNSRPPWQQLAWGASIGLCVYLAYATRSMGIVLIPAIGGAFLFRFRENIILLMSMAAVSGFFLLVHKSYFHSDGDYAAYFSVNSEVVLRQTVNMIATMAIFLKPGYGDYWTVATILVFGSLAAVGFAVRVRQAIRLPEAFVIFYPIPLLLFDNYIQLRYYVAILPLFLFYIVVGTAWGASRLTPAHTARTLAAVVGVVALIYGARYTTLDFGPLTAGIGRPESVALFDYVKQNTGKDETIVFFKPRVMALMTGRPSASYYGYRNTDEMWGMIRRVDAGHIVVEHLPEGAIYGSGLLAVGAFIDSCPRCFDLTFSNRDFDVYRVTHMSEGAAAIDAGPPPYRPVWRE